MVGAIIGDIVGSRFEWHNITTKKFKFFHHTCTFTDDTVMTCAIAQAILEWDSEGRPSFGRLSELTITYMREFGSAYPGRGYGGHFQQWLDDKNMGPYHSCGNGSAMRVSPVGWAARSLDECIAMSNAVTAVTHDHPDGIMGAEATAVLIYLARNGASSEELHDFEQTHYYPITYDMEWLQENYRWSSVCDQTCQAAYVCLHEAKDYEDCIRNCMSIGGDSDTIGTIAGGIAEAVFGIPAAIKTTALSYLDDTLRSIQEQFTQSFITG
ncbi:MAG: ADP-ribosylglycohydrolase family protein [Sphaerochaetaceae bacterium]|jgi:type I restriction enzyme M protein|nr:ADP-ribosylglycohydrolase family protein [Sphaerochaetaceae bacterium]